MESVLQDVRYAWRSMLRAPGFTAVVVGVMALGIGACLTIFSIVNGLYFKPYPYIDEQRVRPLFQTSQRHPGNPFEFSFPDFADLRAHNRSFSAVVGWLESEGYLTIDHEPERFTRTLVSPGFFAAVGAPLALGREFAPEEETIGHQFESVILSDRIWRERFAADRGVLGRTIRLNGHVLTVVGVAPPRFRFPETTDFFVPLWHDPAEDTRDSRSTNVIGVLRPGTTLAAAQAELDVFARGQAQRYPDADRDIGARLGGFRDDVQRSTLPTFTMLLAAVFGVLLIACANVANLLLARGTGRAREIGLRIALGATRGRIVRQLLTEGLVLAVLGAFFGRLLATWGRDVILAAIPQELPFWMSFEPDARTLGLTLGITVLAAVLASLAPALQVSHASPLEALRDGTAQGTAGRGRTRMRSVLVVGEIALAIVLLTGTGLFIRGFLRMQDSARVIDGHSILTARVTLPVAVYPDDAARLRFFDRVLPEIRRLPGVRSVAMVQTVPLTRSSWTRSLFREGVATDLEDPPFAQLGIATPGYFRTLGLSVVRGREFDAGDDSTSVRVALVNAAAAARFWPGADPLGHRIRFGARDGEWCTIVGIVPDVRQRIDRADRDAQIFVPHAQEPVQTMNFLVRADAPPAVVAAAVRRVIQTEDPNLPLYEVHTMAESTRLALWEQRLYLWLMTVFATIALVIAGVGLHGLMAYSVAQRTQEIGIRMALGAAQADVVRLVVGQAARITLIGIGIGLAAAFAVTRLMASIVFGINTTDPPTFAVVSVLLAASAVLAAWLPARRAARVDPMVALRAE